MTGTTGSGEPAGPDVSAASSSPGEAQGGFTLLEALVALAVVGLAVVGATEAASRTLRAQAEVSRHAEAVALADAALDEASLLNRDSLEHRDGPDVETVRLEDDDYRVVTRSRPAGDEGRLWRLEAQVGWTDGTLRLATTVYRPDRSPVTGTDP